jgi:adenine C2-methylase RlmN of 23S rRNA A2503 and tRNA A37
MISDGLASNKYLKTIYLNRNHISDEGAVYFFEMLKDQQSVETVLIDHNQIADEGGLAMAKCLE